MNAFYLMLAPFKLGAAIQFSPNGDTFVLRASTPPPDASRFFVSGLDGYLYLCQGSQFEATCEGISLAGVIIGRESMPKKGQCSGCVKEGRQA